MVRAAEESKGYDLGVASPVRDTPGAILFQLRGGESLWVPKSMIHDDSEVWKTGQEAGRLIVKEYWAEKRGLLK
jgi:hypothetical protein